MDVALVTGATGWLGSRFVRALSEGLPEAASLSDYRPPQEIRCLVTGPRPTGIDDVAGVNVVRGDITVPGSLGSFFAGAEGATLFHCAGIIHPRWSSREFMRVNGDGTANIVRAASRARVQRMVHVSSNSPFGANGGPAEVFTEDSPFQPYMSYGRSKARAEQVVAAAAAAGDLEAAIVRVPWFYGPFQPPRQTTFFRMVKAGKFPILGDGEQRRSMAYLDNICQGLLLCGGTTRAGRGEAYWIADETPYSMNEIVATVEAVLRDDFGIAIAGTQLRLPAVLADVARIGDRGLQAAGLYLQKIHVLSEMNQTIACSITHARRELGYAPTVALREGMRRSVEWLLRQGEQL